MPQTAGDRWSDLRKLFERAGPFTPQNFEPSAEILEALLNNVKILVVGKLFDYFVFVAVLQLYGIN